MVLGLNLGLYNGWLVYFGAYVADIFAASATVLSLLFFFSGATELLANNLTPPLLRRIDAVSALYVLLAAVGTALLLTGIVIPGAFLAAVIILNGTAGGYIAANAILLGGERSHPGAVMSVASASIGIGNALGPLITGMALASTDSFAVAYRALGLLAPLCIAIAWIALRGRAPAVIAEQVS